jgi:hypothetical protein
MAASQWRAVGCLTSVLVRKSDGKKEALTGVVLFIGEGDREEVILVPHIGDSRPTACRSGGNTVQHQVPLPQVIDQWGSVSILKGGASPYRRLGGTVHSPTR